MTPYYDDEELAAFMAGAALCSAAVGYCWLRAG